LQEAIVTQLHAGDARDVERLITEDLPLENRLLTVFDRLIGLVRAETRRAAQQAEDDVRDALPAAQRRDPGCARPDALGHAIRAPPAFLGTEAELFEEKDLEELTLQNIIDGSHQERCRRADPDHEPGGPALTGWSEEQARGRLLDSVYVVRESNSDTPLGIPDSSARSAAPSRARPAICTWSPQPRPSPDRGDHLAGFHRRGPAGACRLYLP
jgi:hypothetical protein